MDVSSTPGIGGPLAEALSALRTLGDDAALVSGVDAVAACWAAAVNGGHKLLFAGNGGSAAQAQHAAAEWVGRFAAERDPVAALALSADSVVGSALANDYGYQEALARQVRAFASPGDVLTVFSTSGKSGNILGAVAACRERAIEVVAFTGASAQRLVEAATYSIAVPLQAVARVQEAHMLLCHLAIAQAERMIKPVVAGAHRSPG